MPADDPSPKPSPESPAPEAVTAAAAPLNGNGNGHGSVEKQAASGLIVGALGVVFQIDGEIFIRLAFFAVDFLVDHARFSDG